MYHEAMDRRKKPLRRILAIAASAAAGILVLWLLYLWTLRIEERGKGREIAGALSEAKKIFQDKDFEGFTNIVSPYSKAERENMEVYEKCAPSVVHISAFGPSPDGISPGAAIGRGSGFVCGDGSHIVTCLHVVSGAPVLRVSFADGAVLGAHLAGGDEENDIAVLQVQGTPSQARPLQFETGRGLRVGQRVYAIGNPLGYDRTLSTGYVSGLGRTVRDPKGRLLMGTIQTDLAISPGNSGCPLLDTDGKVVGLVVSTYSETGNFEAMSFALAADVVQKLAAQLARDGRIERGWLDIVALPLDPQIIDYASLDVPYGLLVSQTAPGGQAARAGLKAGTTQVKYGNSVVFLGGDVITKINGVPIKDRSSVFTALMDSAPDGKAALLVRRNGKDIEIETRLVPRTEENLQWLLR